MDRHLQDMIAQRNVVLQQQDQITGEILSLIMDPQRAAYLLTRLTNNAVLHYQFTQAIDAAFVHERPKKSIWDWF